MANILVNGDIWLEFHQTRSSYVKRCSKPKEQKIHSSNYFLQKASLHFALKNNIAIANFNAQLCQLGVKLKSEKKKLQMKSNELRVVIVKSICAIFRYL